MATPRGPRPGDFPPNFSPDTLSSSLQNLQINQSNRQQLSNASGGGAPWTSNALPFGQQPPSFAAGQSRPPPPGVFQRGPAPPVAPGQGTLHQDVMPARPPGPTPASQPPPFASRRPPPPGVLPSSFGGPVSPPYSGAAPRPGPSGPPTPPQMSSNGPAGNGPPAFAPGMMQSGSLTPPMGNVPSPSFGPAQPPTMMSSQSPSQPLQTPPRFGSPPAAVPSSVGQPGPPFSTFPQGPMFSGSSQNMAPPPGSLAFPPPLRGTVQSSDHLYGMESWPQQPPQVTF